MLLRLSHKIWGAILLVCGIVCGFPALLTPFAILASLFNYKSSDLPTLIASIYMAAIFGLLSLICIRRGRRHLRYQPRGMLRSVPITIALPSPDSLESSRNNEMSPADYEMDCARRLQKAGWMTRVQGGSGDQGVDIVATRSGVIAVFQCKYYSSPVGNSAVQQVHTGKLFHQAHIAAVITNAGYTSGAREAAMRANVLLLSEQDLDSFLAASAA